MNTEPRIGKVTVLLLLQRGVCYECSSRLFMSTRHENVVYSCTAAPDATGRLCRGLLRSIKALLPLYRRSAAKVNRARPNQSYILRGAPYG